MEQDNNKMKKLIFQVLGLPLLAAGLGGLPTWHLAGEPGLWAMAAAGLICLVGAAVGMIPLAYVLLQNMRDWWAQAALAGMTLRMFVTLALAILAAFVLPLPGLAFWVWVLVFYFSFLIGETTFAIRAVNHSAGQGNSLPSPSARGAVS